MVDKVLSIKHLLNTASNAIESFKNLLQPYIDHAQTDYERLYYHHIHEEEEQRYERVKEVLLFIDQLEGHTLISEQDWQQLLQYLNVERFGLHNFIEHLDLTLHHTEKEEHKQELEKWKRISSQDYETLKEMIVALKRMLFLHDSSQVSRLHDVHREAVLSEYSTTHSPATHTFEREDHMTENRSDSDYPLSDTQVHELKRMIAEEAARTRVGRNLLPVYGPVGKGVQSIHLDSHFQKEHKTKRNYLPLVMLYSDFTLHWRDIEQAKALNIPVDFSPAIQAVKQVIQQEEQLIFHGENEQDIPGLMDVHGRLEQPLRAWEEAGEGYDDVIQARQRLLTHGYNGPFALILSPERYTVLHRVQPHSRLLEIDQIQPLMEAGVYTSTALSGDEGVILEASRHVIDLVISEEIQPAYLGEEELDYPFRLYETLVHRIKRPDGICTLQRK